MKTKNILIFILVTYLLTLIGGTVFFNQEITENIPNGLLVILKVLFIPAIIAPLFTAALVKFIENGKSGIKELFKYLIRKNTRFYWYLIAIIVPQIVHLLASLIDSFRGTQFLQPYGNADASIIIIVLQIFLLAGIAEEMGWRAYLQPALQKKLGSAFLSVIIGIVVAVWHLPLFFQQNDIHYNNSFVQFLVLMIVVAFIYTWLMDNTGNILVLAIFHTSHDIASLSFSQTNHVSAIIVYGIVAVSIMLYFGPKFFSKIQHQSRKEPESL